MPWFGKMLLHTLWKRKGGRERRRKAMIDHERGLYLGSSISFSQWALETIIQSITSVVSKPFV